MEEMQGENTENPYENGTVQPCRFLSARSGQEAPGICLMEIRTELLHGDKTKRQKGPRQAPAGYRRSVRGLFKKVPLYDWEGARGWDHRRFKKLVMMIVFMKSMNRLPTRGTTK